MFTKRRVVSFIFVFSIVYLLSESSAHYLNCANESTYKNGFDGFGFNDVVSAENYSAHKCNNCIRETSRINDFSRPLDKYGSNDAVTEFNACKYLNCTRETSTRFNCSLSEFNACKYLNCTRETSTRFNCSLSVPYTKSLANFDWVADLEVVASDEDDIYMIVVNGDYKNGMTKNLWLFVKAISWEVFVEIGITSIFVGVAIKYMEYRMDNADFSDPLLHQFFHLLWFPFSILIFREGHIANKCSKGVIVIWLCVAFIVTQCYIANLSSFITDNQPQPPFPVHYNYVGYKDGSSVKNILIQQFGFMESQLKPYSNNEEYHLGLSKGIYKGGVDAIFDRSVNVGRFIRSYGSQYIKIGPISKAIGFGFAFSSGSDFHFSFPIKSVDVDESSKVGELRNKLDKYPLYQHTPSVWSQTRSLSAYNFGGLFIIAGILIMLAILCSEYSIWRKSMKIQPSSSGDESSVHSTSEMIQVHEDLNIVESSSSTSSSINAEDNIIQEELHVHD